MKKIVFIFIVFCLGTSQSFALTYLEPYDDPYYCISDFPYADSYLVPLPPSDEIIDNGETVYINYNLINQTSNPVNHRGRVKWYQPDGELFAEYEEDSAFTIDPNAGYICWWFNLPSVEQPGTWQVDVEIKETIPGGDTNWQDFLKLDFDVADIEPDITKIDVSNSNPKPGDTIELKAYVSEAAQYAGEWDDDGSGGLFDPQNMDQASSLPGDHTHITNYTVPQLSGQTLTLSLSVENNQGDDTSSVDIDICTPNTYYLDNDSDGYGDPGNFVSECSQPSGYVTNSDDCDDSDASIHPDATEVCNGKDEDCDGDIDEGVKTTYYRDNDEDGYGDPNNTKTSCSQPDGYVQNSDDCDDSDAKEHPGQTWYKDADDDGYSDGTTNTASCSRPSGYFSSGELIQTAGDCDDSDASIHPDANEVCNGKDEDCDGDIDEGVKTTYYLCCSEAVEVLSNFEVNLEPLGCGRSQL